MAELRRRRTKMSEITTTKLVNEDSNNTDGERSEDSCDFPENISLQGDRQEIPLEQLEEEEKPLEYVASVDVTVESRGCEDDSSSNTGSEGEKVSEWVANEDTTSASSNEGENDQDHAGEDSDEDVDGESVTCTLLGLEQAKVNLIR